MNDANPDQGQDPTDTGTEADPPPDLSGSLEAVEAFLLGDAPCLTRAEVSDRAGMSIDIAQELWRLMGFPHTNDDDVAFTEADVRALELSRDLMDLGILTPERQSALVRTWGRSFARLAEWQTSLLTSVALENDADPAQTLAYLTQDVLPRVDELQSYVWRRHLAAASSRMLAVGTPGAPATRQAVVFVDIVGYTSQSKTLSDEALVAWLEHFESTTLELVVDRGGRIIKNIGDEVLFVCDDVEQAAATAWAMVQLGADEDESFPEVRAGIAYGDVVSRLGDVFGPTVNIAARLTSIARPGTVVINDGAYEALSAIPSEERSFRRIRRVSVKGYSRLPAYAMRLGPEA